MDFPNVAYVFNYDLPTNIDDFIHRVGRCGRCGNSGNAVSFYNQNNSMLLKELYNFYIKCEQEIPDWFEEEYRNDKGSYFKQGYKGKKSNNNIKSNFSSNSIQNRGGAYSSSNVNLPNRIQSFNANSSYGTVRTSEAEITKTNSASLEGMPRFFNSQRENVNK